MVRGTALSKRVGWLTGIVALIGMLQTGCGVVLNAPEVSVLVRDDRIVYVGGEADAARLVGGETVLRVSNDSGQPRQIVLARLGTSSRIPDELLKIESPRDDRRVLGMSHELEPKKSTFASGGFGYEFDTATFHVYLAPDEHYVIFDRLGGYEDGVLLELVPRADRGGGA